MAKVLRKAQEHADLIVRKGLLRAALLRQQHADVVVGDGVGWQQIYRSSVSLIDVS